MDSRNAKHRAAAIEPPTEYAGVRHGWPSAIAAAALGVAVSPAAATVGAPVHAAVWQGAIGALAASAVAVLAVRAAPALYLRPIGALMAGVACWLLAQSSYPVAGWLIAPTLGLAIAFAGGRWRWAGEALASQALGALSIGAAAAGIVLARVLGGRDVAMAAGAIIVAASAIAAMTAGLRLRERGPRGPLLAVGGALLALLTSAYIGATTPSATWFGSLIDHGPRDGNEVAITFDDGPNPGYTLQISAILDNYGVKATFFTVGKALEARPDVSKALLDDGHLLGNHSYHHDAFRWLDPGYPELEDTQAAFKRTLGVCPGLFRPPHGTHTPFMAKEVSDHRMKMVTWDVSAADWSTSDGALVAKRVLEKVKPGSIILLHDGIDGNIGADRSVILTALPLILDGLRERGLKPVTLDKLLGVPAYVDSC